MKMTICSIPLRDLPCDNPPLGTSRILDSLIEAGYTDSHFYNLDVLRPTETEILEYFHNEEPDILGISAVVSTSYKYVKWLSTLLRSHFPQMAQIIGGNLVASADVLLKKCPLDVCVVGEGENIVIDLVKHWDKYENFKVNEDLREIKGIVFSDPEKNGEAHFSGYAASIPTDEIRQFNYQYLSNAASIDNYLPILSDTDRAFRNDIRRREPHRQGKRIATIITTKGCVARCTFCHRWSKGYKMSNVDKTIEHIQHLKEAHNVGFLSIGDENFGSSIKHAEEFVEKIRPLDLLWKAAGMRTASVKGDLLKKMKEAGCTAIYYGIESGSDKMLRIMDKGATVEQNLRALKLTREAGLHTILQLVIGMPGESTETIKESAEFVKKAVAIFKGDFKLAASINYAQALPGTPLYEYLRLHNFIGNSIDEEEEYLLKISDQDAASMLHYINTSQEKIADVIVWPDRILVPSAENQRKLVKTTASSEGDIRNYQRGDYFRLSRDNPLVILSFRLLGDRVFHLLKIYRSYRRSGSVLGALRLLLDQKCPGQDVPARSLRKTMREANILLSDMQPLRDGR